MLAKKIVSIDIDKKNPNHHQQKSNIDQHRQKKSVIINNSFHSNEHALPSGHTHLVLQNLT